MEYRNYNNVVYLRLDKGDEVLSSILRSAKKKDSKAVSSPVSADVTTRNLARSAPTKERMENTRSRACSNS